MSGNNNESSSSRLVRPDGMPADMEPVTVKLYEIEYPVSTDDPKIIATACLQDVEVRDPLTGQVTVTRQMAMFPQTLLLLVETVKALEVRDQRIEALEERVAELARRFDDPTERDRQEGYDGA